VPWQSQPLYGQSVIENIAKNAALTLEEIENNLKIVNKIIKPKTQPNIPNPK